MAKEKEKSPQEGLQENKLKALQAAMAKIAASLVSASVTNVPVPQ